MSQQFKTRPSELYRIEDPLLAYYFDRAIMTFGTFVENDIREATREAKTSKEAQRKATRVIDKWLRDPDAPQKFRDPAARH